MKSHKNKTYDRGINAEKLAVLWLRIKGYEILAQRYKTPVGEVDIIAKKNRIVAFIEVKARQTKTHSLESITTNMCRRIERAALHYMSQHKIEAAIRFDLISVTPPFFIQHLDNAWRPSA